LLVARRVRWVAPNGIQLPPETVVAAAEAAGLGAALDAMVLDLACSGIKQAGLDLDLHVNIGATRLGNPAFEQHVRQTVARHGIPPNQLVVEITATVPILDLADAAAQITRLNAVCVRVALDDFGAEPDRDVTLYRSVIGLCDELDFEVIAEGIESTAKAETVVVAGCRLAQGHRFRSPAPIAEISLSSSAHR
jgi:diguanylate cyclase